MKLIAIFVLLLLYVLPLIILPYPTLVDEKLACSCVDRCTGLTFSQFEEMCKTYENNEDEVMPREIKQACDCMNSMDSGDLKSADCSAHTSDEYSKMCVEGSKARDDRNAFWGTIPLRHLYRWRIDEDRRKYYPLFGWHGT